MPFKNLKVLGQHDNKRITFEIHDVDLSIVNSVRRIILAKIPHIGIHFDPYEPTNNDVIIHANKSALHNEFLGHRISMIPLYFPPSYLSNFDPYAWNFKLSMKNESKIEVMDVTTANIVVEGPMPSTQQKEFVNILFPPYIAPDGTKYFGQISRLKPGEEIDLEFKARIDVAQHNALFCPVSLCTFENLVDEQLVAIEQKKHKNIDAIALNRFNTIERQHLFVKNERGEPSAFVFKIESESGYSGAEIFARGMRELIKNISALTWTRDTRSEIGGMHVFRFVDTDHTLGNLLQCILYNERRADLEYVGYTVPHPLKMEMNLKLKLVDHDTNVDQFLKESITMITAKLTKVHDTFIEFAM